MPRSRKEADDNATSDIETPHHATIHDLLSNALILDHLSPYLSVLSRIRLKSASKSLKAILQNSDANIWRYVDLSRESVLIDRKRAHLSETNHDTQMPSLEDEEDTYDQGLRFLFQQVHFRSIYQSITTLILDGLPVTAKLVHEIITDPSLNVRILSIREVVHMNERTLIQVLGYAVRTSRPEGSPKLKGLYFFGPRDEVIFPTRRNLDTSDQGINGVMNSLGAQIGAEWNQRSYNALSNTVADDTNAWYQESGRVFKRRTTSSDWPDLIRKCQGIIAFDAVLCPGVAHTYSSEESESAGEESIGSLTAGFSSLNVSRAILKSPEIASIALGSRGCENCHSCPEGFAVWGRSPPERFPLLAPPPRHGSNVRAARAPYLPGSTVPSIILRCESCMRGRWCEGCGKWWCEACYDSEYDTRTAMQKVELLEDQAQVNNANLEFKVHLGLCVESCLVSEMMSGAGSYGMWG